MMKFVKIIPFKSEKKLRENYSEEITGMQIISEDNYFIAITLLKLFLNRDKIKYDNKEINLVKCPKCEKIFDIKDMDRFEYFKRNNWKMIPETDEYGFWICPKCGEK